MQTYPQAFNGGWAWQGRLSSPRGSRAGLRGETATPERTVAFVRWQTPHSGYRVCLWATLFALCTCLGGKNLI